jgi:hypothetical protein
MDGDQLDHSIKSLQVLSILAILSSKRSMRGRTACPREVPIYADTILDLSEEEWAEFGLAFAYGQTVPKEDFEDLFEFRKFYRAKLPGSDGSRKGEGKAGRG